MFKSKNIFVTGGAGVIGLQLVPILLAAGHKVIVGDIKERPENFSLEIEYLQGDLNCLTEKKFLSFNAHIIIHLAATFERSTESYEFYSDNFDNNLRLSNHIMKMARSSETLERVLFASSYLVYKKDQYIFNNSASVPTRLSPESLLGARNLIGSAKLFHESELNYISSFSETKFSIVIPRIYRGYGLGSRDVISRWVRAALADEELIVYDLDGSFDYIYCKDSALGIFKLACETNYAGVVDLGTGRSRKVSEILEILRSHFPNLRIKQGNSTGIIEASEADTNRLRAVTNWVPEYHIEKAIPEIIEFESLNG